MKLNMTVAERHAFLEDLHVGVISIEQEGQSPLAVPIATTKTAKGHPLRNSAIQATAKTKEENPCPGSAIPKRRVRPAAASSTTNSREKLPC